MNTEHVKLRLLEGKAVDDFMKEVRKAWKGTKIKYLERGLRFNLVLKQQTELRLQVLQELIDESDKRSSVVKD